MTNRNILGKNIKKIRNEKGISQEMLMAKLNVLGIPLDQAMLSRIENQTRYILDYEIKAISTALNVKISDLFKE